MTVVTVASLALAIGATSAIFSLINAALLRPLPYRDSGRLALLWTTNTLNNQQEQNTSLLNLDDWRARSRTFEDMAPYREGDGPLIVGGSEAQWIDHAFVGGNFFSLVGRTAAIGRTFDAADANARRPVAILSHRLWRQTFGGTPDAIGKRLNISGLDLEIIGVMPAGFWFPTKEVDLWVPATISPRWALVQPQRATRFGPVIGRLRPNATVEQARTEMRAIGDQLRREHPVDNVNLGVNVVLLSAQVNGPTLPFMLAILFAAVTCVLLIACANVASLQLSRGLGRRREIAVRAALGAARIRIVRQLLTESVLLACVGGVIGLVLAAGVLQAMTRLAPAGAVRLTDAQLDATVLAFTFGLSVATGVLFGLAPAIRVTRDGAEDALHGRNAAAGASTRRLGAAFVVGEFALAVVLLSGAGLLIRSLAAVHSVASRFGDASVMTAHVRFHTTLPRARRAALYGEAMDRIGAIGGVRAAGGIATMFWRPDTANFGLRAVEDRPAEPREAWSALTWTTISGRYFQALGVPLVRGRFFTDQDRAGSPPVVLVNETMARRFWPGGDAVGKRIKGFDARGRNDEWVTVVGVVGDLPSRGLERAPMAQIFEPQAQSLDETENLVVSSAATTGAAAAVRSAIRELDPTAVVGDFATLDAVLGNLTSQRRFQTYVLSAFALLALTLAGAGVFGTMHYAVLQRTQELGIRMALGADRRQVLAMIFREGVGLAALGVFLGLAGALVLMPTLSSLLFGVSPTDPLTFVLACAVLTVLAFAGCYLPAARAARVDPMLCLRAD